MPRTIHSLRVFIASPGGLAAERRAFQEMLQKYSTIEGKGRGVQFEAVGWEETLGSVGQRPQESINEEGRAGAVIRANRARGLAFEGAALDALGGQWPERKNHFFDRDGEFFEFRMQSVENWIFS